MIFFIFLKENSMQNMFEKLKKIYLLYANEAQE
jgi:hypothetical protein